MWDEGGNVLEETQTQIISGGKLRSYQYIWEWTYMLYWYELIKYDNEHIGWKLRDYI